MLTYSFTNLKNESLYMHLYQCIRQDIVDGKLVSGEKLPSKRSFAKNLGLSTITIENAYAQLLSEGYIYSIPKKGFYVSDFKNNVIKPVRLTTENVKLSSGQSDFLADFSSNQTRPENFPFSIWAKLMRETFNTNSPELMTKPPCGGIMGLRQAIATHLEQFRGMHVQPEQIFIGAGTEYLYGLLIQLLGFDKKYAIENPGYEKIAAIGEGVRKAYEEILVPAGMGDVKIFTELGRFMLAPHGHLVVKAIHEKHTYKEYIGVDACAANLMRPAMYGAYHHITVMGKENEPCDHTYDVVGSLCENNDKFAIDRKLPKIDMGDLLVLHDTGAHGFAMGYNYNGRLKSAEILLQEDGSTRMIRRAETPEDYFATIEGFDF